MPYIKDDLYVKFRGTDGTNTSAWSEHREPDAVSLLRVDLLNIGAVPYYTGTNWAVDLAFCYEDAATGLEEGIDLTAATMDFTAEDVGGAKIFEYDETAGITVKSQAVARSAGGTMGEVTLAILAAEEPVPAILTWQIKSVISSLTTVLASGRLAVGRLF